MSCLGGKTGLVHISEVADNYVKDINEHLTVGDEVTVKVLNVGDDGKIGLSIKKAKDNPPPSNRRKNQGSPKNNNRDRGESFEQKMNRFLKDSEDRLATLKKHTESKRGGGGGGARKG
ncbi:RNA binding protein [Gracilibacillus boraciitolerans JCM 21714]|uniref:RNA binding protein n=1 Tax=Gracilibacillus boraciitolerans JCM 21714 TaxID=1298598 RepID=W4VLX1_9BACI|nr:RNA binding protein [Gracilibacillus boraciitolerans JCM 21714]